jgi:hypothetical protein
VSIAHGYFGFHLKKKQGHNSKWKKCKLSTSSLTCHLLKIGISPKVIICKSLMKDNKENDRSLEQLPIGT